MQKKTAVSQAIFVLFACLLFVIALAGWYVDFLEIKDTDSLLYSAPLAHGQRLTTSYVHSVEKTDVEDDYRILNGKLWTWEERVRSSNAGMPSILPKYTRFINSGNGLIFRGGRIALDSLNLRIGNEKLGQNRAELVPFKKLDLYKILPGKLLTLEVARKAYLYKEIFTQTPFNDWLR